MLDKDLITQPHLWTMGLLIGRKSIGAMFVPPVDADDIIYRSIPLDPAAKTPLRAIEDAIYDNPLLLNSYRHVSATVDTDSFIILPDGLGDDGAAYAPRAIRLAAGLDDANGEPASVVTTAAATDTSLHMELPVDLAGFLRRTFFNVNLTHPLAPIARWLSKRPDAEPCMVAALRDDRLDIVAMNGPRLLLANTFTVDGSADAAYRVLLVRSTLPLPPSAPMYVAGESEARAHLTETISAATSRWSAPVAMPLPPRVWRSGQSVASIPLTLLLNLLQCE